MTLTRTLATFAPPVMEARRWLEGVTHPIDRPLLNVSQAAPVDPPPLVMRQAIADIVLNDPEAHLYGAVLGLPALRCEIAQQWNAAYLGNITESEVAITSGCNQAFAAAIATLCTEGDEVILPVPYYFNHRMWLDMSGVNTVALDVGPAMIPDAQAAEKLITSRTRAICLVSPNNPTGVEYPAETLQAFFDLCQKRGIALIVDETYRDFDSRSGAPHALFQNPDWADTLIQLYSFSKAYRLTGHRVGAIVASVSRLAEVEKFLDTVAICPNQIGQRAALWGMQNLTEWLAGERLEILDRRSAIINAFPALADKGWTLKGCGAYFAYLQHPFAVNAAQLAQNLVATSSILTLPGTMFMPSKTLVTDHTQSDINDGAQHLRIAFANIDRSGITTLINRLAAL
ncbi:aminotransferase [Yoonia sp. MH D7]